MLDPKGYEADANLDSMEMECWNYTRYLELKDEQGRVLFSWDIINTEFTEYVNYRKHFDNLSCYLYYSQYHRQLRYEFIDPAALQYGDSWDDALARGVDVGVTIPECRIYSTESLVWGRPSWSIVVAIAVLPGENEVGYETLLLTAVL